MLYHKMTNVRQSVSVHRSVITVSDDGCCFGHIRFEWRDKGAAQEELHYIRCGARLRKLLWFSLKE